MLEIVLGIDNLIFISILVERLPAQLQNKARVSGLALAMLTRIGLLFSLVWITHLVTPLFYVAAQSVSGRDLVLLGGGAFLLVKSVLEMHQALEGAARDPNRTQLRHRFAAVIVQIGLIDIVFSLDSVFTAIGLARELPVMVAAIVVAIIVMMLVSRALGAFIHRHPTIKMLALAFLLLIGFALIAEGPHFPIPKGYLYFAMAFAVGVELLNTRLRRRLDERQP
ncbi:MAG TPA: TerC family protein [Steroidobacteraceae bacterium]|nr:TerC family protein [Steroidobacteraceae bacterium]